MSHAPRQRLLADDELEAVLRYARRARRHAWAGALALVLTCGGVLGTIWLWPRHYRSEAVAYYREGLQWNSNETPSSRRVGQRLKELLLARTQLGPIVTEERLFPELLSAGRAAEAIEAARLAVGFTVDRESEVFVISYTGQSAEEAQRVTARLTEAVVSLNARLRSEQAEAASEFLESERQRNEADLATKEADQIRFLALHPEFANEESPFGASLRARTRQLASSASDEGRIAALEREEERLNRQLATLVATSPPSSSPVRVPTSTDPTLLAALSTAEAKLRVAQRELAERRAQFTDVHPMVVTAANSVKEAEEAYRRAAEAIEAPRTAPPAETPATRGSLAPVGSVSSAPLASLLERRLGQVQQEIASYWRKPRNPAPPALSRETSDTGTSLVALETEWARLTREVAEARERLQQLESRQFMATMSAGFVASGQAAQIVIVDPAYLPVHPTGRSIRWKLATGLALGLVLALAVPAGLALLDDRVLDAIDLERRGLTPVLGVVGLGHSPRHRRRAQVIQPSQVGDRASSAPHRDGAAREGGAELVVIGAPSTPAAAGFRVLAHRLRGCARGPRVLITSALPAEGKTLCAANLALALAEGGRAWVLLLDGNLGAPGLARAFLQAPPSDGAAAQVGRPLPAQPWLAIGVAGATLHTATPALNLDQQTAPVDVTALAQAIGELGSRNYQHLVIDGPAILGTADANRLEEVVDGIVVVVRSGRTRARSLARAVDQLGEDKVLGYVLLEG